MMPRWRLSSCQLSLAHCEFSLSLRSSCVYALPQSRCCATFFILLVFIGSGPRCFGSPTSCFVHVGNTKLGESWIIHVDDRLARQYILERLISLITGSFGSVSLKAKVDFGRISVMELRGHRSRYRLNTRAESLVLCCYIPPQSARSSLYRAPYSVLSSSVKPATSIA